MSTASALQDRLPREGQDGRHPGVQEPGGPRDVFNPAKLTQRELPVRPFTFSFNRLIEDIRQSGLPDKDRLISLLASVQMCTCCGKCNRCAR